MAGVEVATAYLALVPSVKGIQGAVAKELTGVEREAEKSGKKAGSGFSSRFTGAFSLDGATKRIGAFVAGGALVSFLGDSITAASNLGESANKIATIFGDAAPVITDFAKNAARNIGLSDIAARDAAATYGVFGSAAGLAGEDLADFSTEMVTLSGDMASFYNTSPEQAIEAIGAAFRGETEPIRAYGVMLDDATVKAKALEMGLYSGTGALDMNAKVLATQALILDKTKLAAGDFLETSDGLANQQRILAAEFANAQAELGQGLLPIAQLAVGFFRDVGIPVLSGFATAVSGVVGFVSDLPTPVLAAAAALGGIALLNGPFSGAMSSVREGFETAALHAMVAKDKFGEAGGGMAGIKDVAKRAGGAVKGFGSMLLGAVGGPVGLAVTAGITLITMAIGEFAEKQRRAEELAESATTAVEGLAEAFRDGGTAADEAARQWAYNALESAKWGRESENLLDFSARLGLSQRDLVDDMLNVEGASEKVAAAIESQWAIYSKNYTDAVAMGQPQEVIDRAYEEMNVFREQRDSYLLLADAQGQAAAKNAEYAEATKPIADAAQAAATGLADLSEEQKKAAEKTAVSITDNTAMAHTLEAIADQGSAARRSLDSFSAIIDQLTGRNKDAERAARDWNAAIDASTEAAKKAATAGDLDRTALREWNVAALTANETGRNVADTMSGLADDFTAQVSSAYSLKAATGDLAGAQADARAKADELRNEFIRSAEQYGLTGEQAAELATKLGIVQGVDIEDKTFSLIAEDLQAQQALQNVQMATVDGKTVYIDGDTQEFYNDLDALVAARAEKDVVVGAIIAPAQKVTSDFKPKDATITTGANIGPAQTTTNQWNPGGKTIFVSANLDFAIAQVNAWSLPTKTSRLTMETSAAYLQLQQWIVPEKTMKVIAKIDDAAVRNYSPPSILAAVVPGGHAGGAVGYGDDGGATYDSGSWTRDDQWWLLHRGEHILDAGDVKALGGQKGVYQFRRDLHDPRASMTGGAGQTVVVRIEGDGELAALIRRNASVVVAESTDASARRLAGVR